MVDDDLRAGCADRKCVSARCLDVSRKSVLCLLWPVADRVEEALAARVADGYVLALLERGKEHAQHTLEVRRDEEVRQRLTPRVCKYLVAAVVARWRRRTTVVLAVTEWMLPLRLRE